MNFGLYSIYGLILSFWLATIYKKTKSVFFCVVFHGFSNLLLSFFVIKINWILVVGLILSLAFTIWLYYEGKKSKDNNDIGIMAEKYTNISVEKEEQ